MNIATSLQLVTRSKDGLITQVLQIGGFFVLKLQSNGGDLTWKIAKIVLGKIQKVEKH